MSSPWNNFFLAQQLVYTDSSTGQLITYGLGDIVWVLTSTALVWIMIPGVGFFYSGLLRRKNALSMIFTSILGTGVVSFQVSAGPLLSAIHYEYSKFNTSGSSGDTHLPFPTTRAATLAPSVCQCFSGKINPLMYEQ